MASTSERHRTAVVLLAAYSAFLAFVLLNPSADVPSSSITWLSDLGYRVGLPDLLAAPARVEFLTNVLIAAPVSFLGSLVLTRLDWRDWTALAFLVSGTVELVQGLLLPARSATYSDVVANTGGALAGAVTFAVLASATRLVHLRAEG